MNEVEPQITNEELTYGQHTYFTIRGKSLGDAVADCNKRGLKFLNAERLFPHRKVNIGDGGTVKRPVYVQINDAEGNPFDDRIKNGRQSAQNAGFQYILLDEFDYRVKAMAKKD